MRSLQSRVIDQRRGRVSRQSSEVSVKRIGLREDLRANYENYYDAGETEWRRLGAIDKVANIVSLCGRLPKRSVLEIGAGEGSILQKLSDIGFGERLYGIEISPSGVAAIREKHIARLVECNLFDGYHVPYAEHSFDVALMSHVLEHVEHPRQLLYEAARVATYIFVEVPLEDTLRLSSDFLPDRVGHINFYSPTTIRRLVQSSHLRILAQRINNPSRATYLYQKGRKGLVDYYLKEMLIHLAPRFATRLFVYHCALLCEDDGQPSVPDAGAPVAMRRDLC